MTRTERRRRMLGVTGYLIVLAVLLLTPSPSDLVVWGTVIWLAGGLIWMYSSFGGPAAEARRRYRRARDPERWATPDRRGSPRGR